MKTGLKQVVYLYTAASCRRRRFLPVFMKQAENSVKGCYVIALKADQVELIA
ncbi:hypothetical protein [Rufibacter sp. XAAS-G3-1]|uniref:hypothetical protein n=1 Tax=Rufibacter sp. XAAS-G3-1 TaxID=2729134 RepID=UPI0015E7AFE7|nr:hypothetical protein [Rufibacter sp. XAAS-G3-1]